MKNIIKKWICRILLTLLCVVAVICAVAFVGSKIYYRDFFADAQRGIKIPGLQDGFIPQGFSYDATKDLYYVCGYMKDSAQSSRIYTVTGGETRCVELLDTTGAPYTEHCGGITVNGEYIYISADDGIDVFSVADVLQETQVKQLGSVNTGERLSFCTRVDDYVLAGAFYRAGNYETPEYHHVTTPAGDENKALIWVYPLDETAEFGMGATPVAAFSVTDQIQGLEVLDDGKIVLSSSYGLASSYLYLYEVDDRIGTLTAGDLQVPLYYLDSANLVAQVEAPPMSEELVVVDGSVYIMTESASTKYIFGNLIDGRHAFGYHFN